MKIERKNDLFMIECNKNEIDTLWSGLSFFESELNGVQDISLCREMMKIIEEVET
jgi:hypothetical protein